MRCAFCHQGWVMVFTRPFGSGEVEEYGPCPYCPAGERHNEVHFFNDFWSKPEVQGVRLEPWDTSEKPLSTEENRARLRALFKSMEEAA